MWKLVILDIFDVGLLLLTDLVGAAYLLHRYSKTGPLPLPLLRQRFGPVLLDRLRQLIRRARRNWPSARQKLLTGRPRRVLLAVLIFQVVLAAGYPSALAVKNQSSWELIEVSGNTFASYLGYLTSCACYANSTDTPPTRSTPRPTIPVSLAGQVLTCQNIKQFFLIFLRKTATHHA